MEQTENYQLSQWDGEDRILREDFNADNAKVDAALKAEAEARAALAAQVARLGNCQIWTGSYKGTGTCGIDHPTSFTFPKKPVLALISTGEEPRWLFPWSGSFITPQYNTLKWNGSTASWYVNLNNPEPQYQLNYLNNVYRVIAFFESDK